MNIRPASAADLVAITAIYDAILDREEAGPVYTNWQRGKYPITDTARQALEAGTLYVGEGDGFLWGVVNLNGIQLPEYRQIPWSIPAQEDRVAVIHTLCIHPARAGWMQSVWMTATRSSWAGMDQGICLYSGSWMPLRFTTPQRKPSPSPTYRVPASRA